MCWVRGFGCCVVDILVMCFNVIVVLVILFVVMLLVTVFIIYYLYLVCITVLVVVVYCWSVIIYPPNILKNGYNNFLILGGW